MSSPCEVSRCPKCGQNYCLNVTYSYPPFPFRIDDDHWPFYRGTHQLICGPCYGEFHEWCMPLELRKVVSGDCEHAAARKKATSMFSSVFPPAPPPPAPRAVGSPSAPRAAGLGGGREDAALAISAQQFGQVPAAAGVIPRGGQLVPQPGPAVDTPSHVTTVQRMRRVRDRPYFVEIRKGRQTGRSYFDGWEIVSGISDPAPGMSDNSIRTGMTGFLMTREEWLKFLEDGQLRGLYCRVV